MLERLKKLLRPKTETEQAQVILYNFIDVESSDLSSEHGDLLSNIQHGGNGVDGIIVRNVFSDSEVKTILADLDSVNDLLAQINEGYGTIPKPFSLIDQESKSTGKPLSELFLENEKAWDRIRNEMSVNVLNRIEQVLGALSASRAPKVPKGVEEVGHYTPVTFKFMKPGPGNLVPHCGNYFHKEFPSLFSHLGSISSLHNQMSFFLTLRSADEGGELILYDVQWDEAESRPEHTVLEMKTGKKKDLTDARQTKIQSFKPNAGDILVFAGGRIWHRVSHVQGKVDRVTVGGFLSPSKNNQDMYYWS